ncbi:MAG: OmpA family protein [Gammaproteobacteria bacterium]|nr:OmpA family protein [Gammaproteobacteria bacterium]
MMSYFKLFSLAAIAFLLAGCPQNTVPDPEPTDTTYPADTDDASTSGADTDMYGDGEFMDDPSAGELTMVIYFDFDSSAVRAADQDIVSRHAMQLGGGGSVRLEGHADERGSREYNIGLGERRAQAVRQMLLIQGVSADQIATVSFGEERPVGFGSSEADYAQNRRVEFKYSN